MNPKIPENKVVNLTKKNDYIYKSKGKYVIASTHSKKRIWERLGKVFEYNPNKFYAILQKFFNNAIDVLLDMEQEYGEGFDTDERFLLDFPIRNDQNKNLHQGIIVKFKQDLYGEQSGVQGNQVIFLSIFPPRTRPYFLNTKQGNLTRIELTEEQVYGKKEIINERILTESINDKNLFKAIITAGGPGSGKSFVVKHLSLNTGARISSADRFFEFANAVYSLINQPDISKTDIDREKIRNFRKKIKSKEIEINDEVWMNPVMQLFRSKKIKNKLKNQIINWIDGMLPIIIDGTGRDLEKIKLQKEILESIGYDVSMILVNTDLDVALKRNKKRIRSLPEEFVINNHKIIQNNIGHFMSMWKDSYGDFIVVDNSKYLQENTDEWNEFLNNLYKIFDKTLSSKLQNPKGQEVLIQLSDKNLKYYSDLIDYFYDVQNNIKKIKL